jgi:hypothetical protein
MINIDVIEYAFVNESVAQSLCDVLKIESVQLLEKRLIRAYDDKKNQVITHVIYFKMFIQEHIESFIFMLIIKLKQQTLIFDKSWMRKHEVSYHEKTNTIKFIYFRILHSFEENRNEQRKKHFFRKEIFSESIKSF